VRAILCFFALVLLHVPLLHAQQNADAAPDSPHWQRLRPFFAPPESSFADAVRYRSPLLKADGTRVQSSAEWNEQRSTIRDTWMELMGEWPEFVTPPEVEVLEVSHRDNVQQQKIRFLWAPNQWTTAFLLIPSGDGVKPAVVTVYYEPETAIGLGQPHRDYGWRLAQQGFVVLSLGTTEATAQQTYAVYHPSLEDAQVQPLSMLAYIAANGWHLLAARPDVDPDRIGIVGHSFGGKWAMFAACLFDRFACVAVSDPGIMFDSQRPNINYWEPWYLGYHRPPWRRRGLVTDENRAFGAYTKLVDGGHDLHELHALLAPRPFFVSGGSEDPPSRWDALAHLVEVNRLLGYEERVGMQNRSDHTPDEEANQLVTDFFVHFLKAKKD
jgi:dienelactone hydrolase